MQGNWHVTWMQTYFLCNVFCAILGNSMTQDSIRSSMKCVKKSLISHLHLHVQDTKVESSTCEFDP